MKKYIFILMFIGSVGFFSCEPRVELDLSQWGDTAFITDVDLFTEEVLTDVELAEFVEKGEFTTGVRRVPVSGTSVDIDDVNFVVNLGVPNSLDLTVVGILIHNQGSLVEPINNAPIAGFIDDFTGGSFQYRVHSTDKTVHDWTINIIAN